jgi:hypothetical protein
MPSFIIPQGFACPYGSKGDEAAFFAWLKSIPSVTKVLGVGQQLVVTARSRKISFAAVAELIALHRRYGLPLDGLKIFRTPQNAALFKNPRVHVNVYPSPSNPKLNRSRGGGSAARKEG